MLNDFHWISKLKAQLIARKFNTADLYQILKVQIVHSFSILSSTYESIQRDSKLELWLKK